MKTAFEEINDYLQKLGYKKLDYNEDFHGAVRQVLAALCYEDLKNKRRIKDLEGRNN